MKRSSVFPVCFVLLALLLISCSNGTTDSGVSGGDVLGPATSNDDFQGLWVGPDSNYRFTGNSFQYQDNIGRSRPGSFTFTSTQITFIPQQANTWTGYTLNYQVSGTTLALSGSTDQTSGTFERQPEPLFVAANPSRGFNYGYYYYIPGNVRSGSTVRLLVEPNNTAGFTNYTIDDAQTHTQAAFRVINEAKRIADELGTVLLVPSIPRPLSTPPFTEPQILNRVAMQTSTGTHARVDLQLIRMIDNLREISQRRGINLEAKILINGFSAGGNFGNRFTALHPELVQAVVSGGVAGLPILPSANIEGERLIYPVGIADLGDITDNVFNLALYSSIPQFIYMGANDTNDPLRSTHFHGVEEQRIIINVLGTDMRRRFERSQNIYDDLGINATFRIYPGVGHDVTPQMESDIIDFLRSNIR